MQPAIPITLRLSDQKPVTRGSERVVYLHPDDPALVVKVRHFQRQSRRFPLIGQRLLNASENLRLLWLLREITCYIRLFFRENPPAVPLPVAQVRGFVMTDRGPAMLSERVHLRHARLGHQLHFLHIKGLINADHVAALNEFVRRASAWNLPITDLDPKNIVYGDRGQGREFVLVDGFGDYGILRLRTVFSWLNGPINARKFRILADHVGLTWDRATGSFALPPDA